VKFTQTSLAGAYLIDMEPHADERGFFARSACVSEFAEHGLDGHFVQQSVSFNARKGTLRGLHYQAAPHEEDKLVRVTRGAVFDVIELTADNHRELYIPKGFAHGFQTLEDHSEVLYAMTVPFQAGTGRGIRWDDPVLAITWPSPGPTMIGQRDRELLTLEEMQLS
jgi:dTDP-4-dehydrorhamnose 3,5-epimerase